MNKPHHQNNISTMEDLVGGLVGMKDRRTKSLVENCVNSPILHPYDRSFATTWNLGLQDLSSSASPTHRLPAICPGWGCFQRNLIDNAEIFYHLIKQ